MLSPTIHAASDPQWVGETIASTIRADRRNGLSQRLDPSVRFVPEEQGQGDHWYAPNEVNARKRGDCAQLVRAEGAFWGTHVGVLRVPGGFHVWLIDVDSAGKEKHRDPSVERGMERPASMAVYQGGVRVPLLTGLHIAPRHVAGPGGQGVVTGGKDALEKLLAWSATKSAKTPHAAAVHTVAKAAAANGGETVAEFTGKLKASLPDLPPEEARAAAALLAVASEQKAVMEQIRELLAKSAESPAGERMIEAIAAIRAAFPQSLPPLFVNAGNPVNDGAQSSSSTANQSDAAGDDGDVEIIYIVDDDAPPVQAVSGWRPRGGCPGTVACSSRR